MSTNTNLLLNVVKSTAYTKLLFEGITDELKVNGADVRWTTEGIEEIIYIYPVVREQEYRLLYSSATLDKFGTSTAQELLDHWEANGFFLNNGQIVADGRVEFRADLPITIGAPILGAIYLVEKPTTILLGIYTTYQSGLYIKDNDTGSLNDWRRLNIKPKFTTEEFAIVDSTDQSKQLKHDVSGFSTSTIITAIWRNLGGVVAFLSDLVGLNEIRVFSESDYGVVDPGVKIDVTPNKRFKLMNPFDVTLPLIIATGANMEITTTSRSENKITYTNTTEAMFQGKDIGTLAIFDTVIEGNETGSLFDIDGGVISLKFPDFNRWKNLGTVKNLIDFFAPGVVFEVIEDGLKLINLNSATIVDCLVLAFDGNALNVFDIKGINSGNVQIYDNIMESDGIPKLCRVDPGFKDSARLVMRGNNVGKGQLFDTSGDTGAFTAVADNSIGATGIDSVSDSSGIAQFNHSGTSPLLGSTVIMSGFITNTPYNVTGVVSVTSAGSFELEDIAFGTDEATGSYLMNGVTVTATAHGQSNGTGVVLDSDNSIDYNGGGSIMYNVQANSFDINKVFTVTRTGNWSTKGLDQINQRVFSFNNADQEDSHYIVTGFVNNNVTENPAITNNTFRDIAFGTGGAGLIEGSHIERWKLIDPEIGEFIYLGNEDFDGSIEFDFTVISSGGTVDFRFKWLIDKGAGYVDLPDPIEALVTVGSNSQSITKRVSIRATKGDMIKPQITRNSGTSTITTTYATVYGDQ